MAPKVAVYLAACEGAGWLQAQVASILAQVDVELTLFISVDDSRDTTYTLAEELAATHNAIELLPVGHYGSASRHFLHLLGTAPCAGYDYISLADQDDIWLPDKLKRACKVLKAQGSDAYSSNVLAFWSDGRTRLICKSQPQAEADHLMEAPGPGCSFVLSAELVLALRQFLPTQPQLAHQFNYHDWLIYAWAREAGFSWYIDDYAGLKYRQHASNVQGANVGFRHYRVRLQQLVRGNWLLQVRLLAASLRDGLSSARATELLGLLQGGRTGMLTLALKAHYYRRRRRDVWLLRLICLWLVLRGAPSILGSDQLPD